jgi:drug/metabolite transporter (DMT)-like permease
MSNTQFKSSYIALAIMAVVLQSSSFLILKLGNEYTGYIKLSLFLLALVLVFSRAVVWQRILHLVPLSKAYPFTLLTQVIIVTYGILFFNESLKISQVAGLVLILLGLLIISKEP